MPALRLKSAIVLALIATLTLASCAGGTGSTAPPSASTAGASPSDPSSSEPPTVGAGLVGTWTRMQDCEAMLAALDDAGLAESHSGWIVGNWVGDPEEVDVDPDDLCAGARPAEEHSHFFTADGRFGSYDAAGDQVDDGDYVEVDAGTLSFPSHAREFGYDGDIMVTYAIRGDVAEFDVQLPSDCDEACLEAHAWALSAFFGPEPWTRTE